MSISVRIDGNGGNAHAPQRTNNAAGDNAAIGNENFAEHTRIRALSLRRVVPHDDEGSMTGRPD